MTRVDPYADAPRLPPNGPLDFRLIVGAGSEPVELELGPGRGWFLVDRLRAVPECQIVGLEIRRKWASIVDRRLSQFGLSGRGRVFAEDAREILPRLVEQTVCRVFVHFPDPWWKKRHAKRLLLCPAVMEQLQRVLVPGGELFVQTDVAERAAAYEALIDGTPGFEPWAEQARIASNPYETQSPRERRVVADDLPVVRLRYRRGG